MKNTVKMLRSNTTGFTFVELLVVIVIMAVLIAASANYLFSTGGSKARDVERKNDMKQVAALIEEFVSNFGSAPNPALPITTARIKKAIATPSACQINENEWTKLIDCLVSAGSIGGDGAIKLKEDPKEGAKNDQGVMYTYYYKAGHNAWKVCALLENQKDPDLNDDGEGVFTQGTGKNLYCLVTQNRELNDSEIQLSTK